MDFLGGVIGVIFQGTAPANTAQDGGYAATPQGREDQIGASIERHAADRESQRQAQAAERSVVPLENNPRVPMPVLVTSLPRLTLNSAREQLSQSLGQARAKMAGVEASFRGGTGPDALARREGHDIVYMIIDSLSHALDNVLLLGTPTWTQAFETARHLADFVINFMPGLSLGKDLISLSTRINPVTGESVGDVEAGLTLAMIVVPGALKGASIGIGQTILFLHNALLLTKKGGNVFTAGSAAGAAAASRWIEPATKARGFVRHLSEGATGEVAHYAPNATRCLSRAMVHVGPAVERSAAELRHASGTAYISRELFDSTDFLRGSHANAGLVPLNVAQSLAGQKFRSFDHLRRAFWTAVSESKYARQLGPLALHDMQKGLAPVSRTTQHVGSRSVYKLHHIQPIQRGGDVYDLSNLMVVTPRFHKDVLNRSYHFGS